MQHGSLIRSIRKYGPAVWQFRWSETRENGQRVYRKRVIGMLEQYSDAMEARRFAAGILAMPSPADLLPMSSPPLKSSSSWIILTFENELWFWWQPPPAYAKVSYLHSSEATSIFPRAP